MFYAVTCVITDKAVSTVQCFQGVTQYIGSIVKKGRPKKKKNTTMYY